ncbi:hypothetical protein CROQUDRAFT_663943 [Cronartium quercuum f. sp. fusiforme G11]|uniref:General negative regulator of transcription subunit n=1 Tax=Cronartium quercuum f. sp. fusiforme G11 TaxID=708437 RepID=A0A9P6NCP0_9BASI|nr:hypothetical protein CROQUDRAFT_663943 [Cronartium quercuum f. sp. fusiforme G11]
MAQRKLQADIDRVLKLVQQGVTLFEETFDKMTHATNQTSKDKAEGDLKTSIKKLQRQRDQIKTWLQSNDIKDKSALMDHRKLIETQMERFKACEKEMKTKAFSKEGLSAQQKLDPKEVAKMEMSHWVSTMVDELGQQIERTEAEVELLRSQTKKKKTATTSDGRGSELEALNDRRRWHIGKLELIMRLLENGQISPERVGEVKDDIQYYVESNTEEDFTEDDDLYESLNLQEEEEQFGMHDDLLSSHDTSSIVEDGTTSATKPDVVGANRRSSGKALHADESGDKSPTKEKASLSSGQLLRGPTVRKSTLESGTVRPTILPGRTGVVTGMVLPSAPAPRAAPAALPSLRYASAAAAAAASSSPASTGVPVNVSVKSPVSVPLTPHRSDSISATGPPFSSTGSAFSTSPKKQSSQLPQRPFAVVASPETKKSLPPTFSSHEAGGAHSTPSDSDHSPLPHDSKSNSNSQISQNGTSSASLAQNPSGHSTQSGQSGGAAGSGQEADRSPSPSHSHISAASHPQPDGHMIPPVHATSSESFKANLSSATQSSSPPQRTLESSSGPGFTEEPSQDNTHVDTFENLKTQDSNLGQMNDILEAGLSSIPQISDAEKPSYYAPRNPYPTSSHYPQQPMAFEKRPAIWGEIEVEVLFYLFYYHQGGYLQYLAAKELKKRAWRFHKYYLTWFQRAKNPEEMADDYEKGSYTYFDWEADWLMRTKTPFQFDYKHLEDSL